MGFFQIDPTTNTVAGEFALAQPSNPDCYALPETDPRVVAWRSPSWKDKQAEAQKALADSDTTMLRILEAVALGTSTFNAPDVATFVSYRRNLRSIISAPTGNPSTTLPTRPPFPKGT